MKRIVICDDDELTRCQLYNIISSYLEQRNIEAEIISYSSGAELYESLKHEYISCLFMDIDLKEEKNGIDIVKQLREIQKTMLIIFVTSYSEYTHKVLPLHTFNYINKPFHNKEICKVLDDVFLWLRNTDIIAQHKLQFKTIHGFVSLHINEILYFEYKNRRIDIVTNSGTFHMYGKIRELYKTIHHEVFAVPHISFIVNMNEIKAVMKSKHYLIMTNDTIIPISQLKTKEFLKQYMNYLKL